MQTQARLLLLLLLIHGKSFPLINQQDNVTLKTLDLSSGKQSLIL